MHLDHPADLDTFTLVHVIHKVPLFESPLVDPDEGQLPEPILFQLEHVAYEGFLWIGLERDWCLLTILEEES